MIVLQSPESTRGERGEKRSQMVVSKPPEVRMQIQRFSPTDDDVHGFCDGEYEAGYGARLAGIEWSMCATRSWQAGWAEYGRSHS
jgi:hypothetical protein